MANETIDQIVDKIAELSAMDLADLSKAIQDNEQNSQRQTYEAQIT